MLEKLGFKIKNSRFIRIDETAEEADFFRNHLSAKSSSAV